jgi:hypothetical protein
MNWVRIVVSLGLMVAAACGGANPQGDSSADPSTPSPSPEPLASPTPSDVLGDILFQDDFSDENSGWPDRPPPGPLSRGLQIGYEDGGYKLEAEPRAKISYLLPAPGSISANHVVIEVDAVHTGRHSLYGVFCKADVDFASAYTFVLDSTGSWAVGKIRDARLEVLGTGTDQGIEPGVAVNHIRADCFDKEPLPNAVAKLQMWINGTVVFSARDRPGLSGPSQSIPGLYLESDFEGDTKIVFDNFIFWGVDPDELTE